MNKKSEELPQGDPVDIPEEDPEVTAPRQESDGKPIEWDGSEAELVASDEDKDFEDVQTGIRLSYHLKTDEIHTVLKRAPFYRKAMLKAKIETGVLILMTLLFAGVWIFNQDANAMIFTIVCAILIGLVWATPYFSLRNHAIKLTHMNEIDLDVYPDSISVGTGEESWKIPLDGSVLCEEYNNMIVLHTGEGELMILPLRCIEPQVLSEVQATIIAGTRQGG